MATIDSSEVDLSSFVIFPLVPLWNFNIYEYAIAPSSSAPQFPKWTTESTSGTHLRSVLDSSFIYFDRRQAGRVCQVIAKGPRIPNTKYQAHKIRNTNWGMGWVVDWIIDQLAVDQTQIAEMTGPGNPKVNWKLSMLRIIFTSRRNRISGSGRYTPHLVIQSTQQWR